MITLSKMLRTGVLLLLTVLLARTGSAYYFYVHFNGTSAPLTPSLRNST